MEAVRNKEQLQQEANKRLQRQLRDLREDLNSSEQRDADTSQEIREMQQRIELLESENSNLVKDLSLAVRRIEDLQLAMQGEMDSSDSDHGGSFDRYHQTLRQFYEREKNVRNYAYTGLCIIAVIVTTVIALSVHSLV